MKKIIDLAKKTLAPATLGVGLALTGCGGAGEPEDSSMGDEIMDEGKEDSVNKAQCGTDYPGVDWEIFVKQKLTSARMKKIASCAIDNLILAKECGIGCDASNPVILYMAPPTPPPVSRYMAQPTTPPVNALYMAQPTTCAPDVDWVLKPNTFLTASRMKELVQCAQLVVDESCGIGCQDNFPVALYSAPPVTRYAAPQ